MAVSKCVSLSNENRLTDNDSGLCFRIDETGCNGTPDFPVAVYLDDVTKDYVNWHWHDEIEVGFVTEGSVVIAGGADRHTLTAGDIFFINSGVLHAMYNAAPPRPAVFKSIAFGGSVVGGAEDSVFRQKYLNPVIQADSMRCFVLPAGENAHGDLQPLLLKVWDAMAEEPMHYEMRVRSGLSELVCILLQIQDDTEENPKRSAYGIRMENRIHLLLDHMHTHYREHITLETLANAAAISKTEVMRCFKSVIGKTPMQYLTEYRLQQAAYLLRHTDHTVQQIGESCGFEDNSYFTKTFRTQYRMTPTEYRRGG